MKSLCTMKPGCALTFLRVTAGLAILPYGLQKVENFSGTLAFFGGMGIPSFIGVLVIVAETVGALSLILGFCTRFCAWSLALIMVGAIIAVHGMGYMAGYATPLLFLLLFLAIAMNGATECSIDGKMKKMR